jgi:hypothetical protein
MRKKKQVVKELESEDLYQKMQAHLLSKAPLLGKFFTFHFSFFAFRSSLFTFHF